MARPEKVAVVDEIKDKLESSRGVFVTEYRGLTVSQQQQLRRSLRAADAEYKVMKMTLARRAAQDAGLSDLLDWLQGPTAIAFTEGDPVPAAKSLKEFADQNDMLVLKGGLLAGETLTADDLLRLASIEPREVLLAKLAGAMAAPMSKLAGLMTAILRQPASAMQQLLEKKEAEPAADKPEEAADEDPAQEPAAEDAGTEDPAAEPADGAEPGEEPAVEEVPEEAAADEPAANAGAETEADVEPESESEPADEAGDETPDDDSKDSD